MACILVTAKSMYLPDSENLYGWTVVSSGGEDYYVRKIGGHVLLAHPCIEEIGKKLLVKHSIVASWVSFAKGYFRGEDPSFNESVFYLIAHDKDLLSKEIVKEGVFRASSIVSGSNLNGLIMDRHIYVFPHIPNKPMFSLFISRLIDESLSENDVDSVVQLIK